MSYTKLYKAPGGHTYWLDSDGRVLVADDSIQRNDPTLVDGGPLYVQRARIQVDLGGRVYIFLRVWSERARAEYWTSEPFSIRTLMDLRLALEPHHIVFDLKDLREAVKELP